MVLRCLTLWYMVLCSRVYGLCFLEHHVWFTSYLFGSACFLLCLVFVFLFVRLLGCLVVCMMLFGFMLYGVRCTAVWYKVYGLWLMDYGLWLVVVVS